jgi:hypothetical protein
MLSSLVAIELGLTGIAIVLALWRPEFGDAFFSKVEAVFGHLARRSALSILAVGVAACLVRLSIIHWVPVPQPYIQDDFSYLLAADTFASGRLTNPTHPMWVHFESFHITHQPTYMSMYFPAQGLVLAAGKIIAGHPWYGVLASVALMCAAICWMLQAWLPPGWALLGGFLLILRIGLFTYWIDSYTGGAVAAIGGALVLGALPRIRRYLRTRDFLWMALGMAVLAYSRPFEGLLVTLPAVVALCWWVARKPHPPLPTLFRRALPAAALLVVTVMFLGYYDYRVFGNPLTLPYQVNRATYAATPYFLWQPPRPEPVYRHEVMRDYYTGPRELGAYLNARTLKGFLESELGKLWCLPVLIGLAPLLALAALPRTLRDRRIRFLVFAAAFFALGLSVETFLLPHYVAPFTAGLYAIILQCMRHLRFTGSGARPGGMFLVRSIPVICLTVDAICLGLQPSARKIPGAGFLRASALETLEKRPGGQLAVVRYAPNHDPLKEWVYNAADIDRSKVVWAREMDSPANRELLEYFKGRTAWLVEPDVSPPRISPYNLQY